MSNNNIDYTYDESVTVDDNSNNSSSTNNNNKNKEPKSEWEKYLDTLDQARLKQLAELAKKNKFIIDGNEYVRKKLKIKQFNELERLRAKFAKEKDEEKAADYLIDTYAKCAEYYLGLDRETYENLDWELTKPILDACNFRTLRGLPN